MKNDLCGKFYKAKIFRIASENNDEMIASRNVAAFDLISHTVERRVTFKGEHSTVPSLFSAVLRDDAGYTMLPVVLSFSPSAGGRLSAASLGQIALGFHVGRRERVLSFLSTIDYLAAIGKLPPTALQTHIARITSAGTIPDRKAFCEEYPAFCERAAKMLPYDESLEILGYLKYGDMEAA